MGLAFLWMIGKRQGRRAEQRWAEIGVEEDRPSDFAPYLYFSFSHDLFSLFAIRVEGCIIRVCSHPRWILSSANCPQPT